MSSCFVHHLEYFAYSPNQFLTEWLCSWKFYYAFSLNLKRTSLNLHSMLAASLVEIRNTRTQYRKHFQSLTRLNRSRSWRCDNTWYAFSIDFAIVIFKFNMNTLSTTIIVMMAIRFKDLSGLAIKILLFSTLHQYWMCCELCF